MPFTPHPHDLLVKKTFSVIENAEGELRAVLPAAIASHIDWSTLRQVNGTFVDDAPTEVRSDLVFSARIGAHDGFVFILWEHQSTVDDWMVVRMLGYMVRLWMWARENGAQRVPVVIPVVLHHSVNGWTASTKLIDLLDVTAELEPALRPFIPNFEILVDDLARVSERELLERAMTPIAKLTIWVLRAVRVSFDPELIEQWAHETSVAEATASREVFRAFVSYLTNVEPGAPVLDALLSAGVSGEVREVVVGLQQEWEENGRREGRREGGVEGRAAIVLKLLRLKFGELPAETVEQVHGATPNQLETWAERVLIAESLDRVFE